MGKRRSKLPIPPEDFIPVESLSHEGRGVAHINGKALFLRNALPQEQVKFQYSNSKSKFAEGYATDIDNPSPLRVTPKCPHYNRCGGCTTQHLKHDAQLEFKQNTLLEHFKHFGDLKPEKVLPILDGPTWNYRSKARLSCRTLKNSKKVFLGFREINGRMITAGQECPILDKKFSNLFEPLADLVGQLSIPDQIPQIELATGDGKAALIIRHIKEFTDDDINIITNFAKSSELDIYLQPSRPKSIHKLFPNDKNERLSYRLPSHDITMRFHPTDFTQVNMAINQKMVAKAIELLEPTKEDTILDLFSGLGNFSLPLAKHCHHVTAVEGCDDMVERGYENAKVNNIDNVAFYRADLFKDIQLAPWSKQRYTKILLDPPRSGAQEIIDKIAQFEAQRIVYVSCNPATLARDAKLLADKGYHLSAAGIIDMFPHTSHVESIALFNKESHGKN